MLHIHTYIFRQGLVEIMTSDPSHLWFQSGTLNVLSHRHLYLQCSKLKMKRILLFLNLFDRRFVNLS